MPSENVKLGDLNAYVVHDPRQRATHASGGTRISIRRTTCPAGSAASSTSQDFSDLDFFRRYDRDPRLHTLSNIYSSAYLTRNGPTYSLNILTDRRDIVLGPTIVRPERRHKQRFEQLAVAPVPHVSASASATPRSTSRWSRPPRTSSPSGLISGPTAPNYYRADIFPTLSLQLRTPAWLSIKPQISVRETYYSRASRRIRDEPVGKLTRGGQVGGPLLRAGTGGGRRPVVLERVINGRSGGFTKFKHVIEPRFRYVYTTTSTTRTRSSASTRSTRRSCRSCATRSSTR